MEAALMKLPSLPFLAALFLIPLLFLLLKKSSKSKSITTIPGPKKLPLIGSLHHIATGEPHRVLTRLARDHGPVMHLRAGQVDIVVISSREAAQEIMQVQDTNFSSRPKLLAPVIVTYDATSVSFSPYGPYWRQLRRICAVELLSMHRVKSFASVRMEEADAFVKDIAASKTPVNLREKLTALNNNVVARATFGKRFKQMDRFLAVMQQAIKVFSGFSVSDLFPSLKFFDVKMMMQLKRIRKEIDSILDEVITERLREHVERSGKEEDQKVDDLLNVLLKAKARGDLEVPISFDNIKAVLVDVLIGGTHTSSLTTEWAMAELLKHPTIMMKVQDDVRSVMKGRTNMDENDVAQMNYLMLVIKETLRLHTLLPLLLPRVCEKTCQVLGYEIPTGTGVIINAFSLGRDPRYWGTDADNFQPERFINSNLDYKGTNFENLPFGAGRRMCPGMAFGAASVELGLAKLLFHFDWELPNGMKPEDFDMTEAFDATVGKKQPLYVVPIVCIPPT